MKHVPFNVNEWLPENQEAIKDISFNEPSEETHNVEQDIERVVSCIESTHTDITTDYNNWVNIGFAFAHELGEMGRTYFHRVSKIYHKYDIQATDKKYDSCLKKQHSGITIKTFFFLAKQAGVDIKKEKKTLPAEVAKEKEPENLEFLEVEENKFNTPLLPNQVYENLPKILRECSNLFNEGIEKDIFFMSALTVLSACLPNLEGTYFNRNLSPHLYLFLTGPSASGKGTMIWARILAEAIHDELFRNSVIAQGEYQKELEDYEALPKNQRNGLAKPEAPPRKMFFIPANSSSSALIQLLSENNFRGIIFESEADTLSNTAKQDWGDSSDIFRKAFHHENTSMARRTNRELIEITNPHLALCLSGTPKQVHTLMPEVENGLFSRFMYYAFHDTRGFLNPFVSLQKINYNYFFTQKSYEIYHLHDKLSKLETDIKFELTEEQGLHFTTFFQSLLDKNKILLSRDLDANTKRLGVITFRIAMILSGLRLLELGIGKQLPEKLVCSDVDFLTALTIATTLESHAIAVYQQMPQVKLKGQRLNFFEKLPVSFNRKQYLAVAKELGIGEKSADRYISFFKGKLLNAEYNEYQKLH